MLLRGRRQMLLMWSLAGGRYVLLDDLNISPVLLERRKRTNIVIDRGIVIPSVSALAKGLPGVSVIDLDGRSDGL